MTEQVPQEKPKPFVPKNRAGVSDWQGGGGVNYIGLNDFGRFTLAFKKLRFEQGQTGKLFYAADCKVITCEPVAEPQQPEAREAKGKKPKYVPMPDDKYQAIVAALKKNAIEGKYHSCWCDPTMKHAPGKVSVISFPVGVPATAADPDRADRDDRVLGEFLRVIQGMPRGSVVDFNILEKLVALPAREDDTAVFGLDCIPDAQPNVIADPATGEVLRVSINVWSKRYYQAVG